MNKIKILFLTMSIFIVSCVTCFADSKTVPIPETSSGRTTLMYTVNGYYQTVYFKSYELGNNNNIKMYNCSLYSLNENNEWQYLREESLNQISDKTGVTILFCDNQDFINDCKSIGINYKGSGIVSPPQIAPTIQGAIQGIVPAFSTQLLNFLPTCIIILSILFGVRLIPRLIAYFH